MDVRGFSATLLLGLCAAGVAPGAHAVSPADFGAFITQMNVATKITDPLQRCLKMPDPPGSHWHADGVAAYCTFLHSGTLTGPDIGRMVAEGHAADVDKAFEGYRKAGLLDAAFARAGFRDATPAMRKALDAWKQQRPQSAYAVAASGAQYVNAAAQARGTASIGETRGDQVYGMDMQANLAAREFIRAEGMKPAIPTMYSDMFALGRMMGSDDYAMAARKKGLALDPVSFSLRSISAAMSSPKWGGSDEMVGTMEREAAALAPAHPILWVAAGQAHVERVTSGQSRPPADMQFVAVADDVSSTRALTDLMRSAHYYSRDADTSILAQEILRFDDGESLAVYNLGKLYSGGAATAPWVMEILRLAATDHPENAELLTAAGMWLYRMGDKANGPAFIDAAYTLGTEDPWALNTIGRYYAGDGHQYDRAVAVADTLIRVDPTNSNGYYLRAKAQIAANDPDRYKAVHVFLDRFGNDPVELPAATTLRKYLEEHPEPGAGT
jgi:tetratricopeptide (TPR) repeat protein